MRRGQEGDWEEGAAGEPSHKKKRRGAKRTSHAAFRRARKREETAAIAEGVGEGTPGVGGSGIDATKPTDEEADEADEEELARSVMDGMGAGGDELR